jgi:hypothetical protein
MTRAYYYEGSGKDIDALLIAMKAGTVCGPVTTIHQVVCIKATIFLIMYS